MSGAFNPSPSKTGAEKGHIEEIILDSLLDADGTALADDVNSYVWAERFAESRVIAYLWHTNQRMRNQWDADRMTDFLPRWEKILGLRPLATDTDNDRRAKVKAKQQLFGLPATQQIVADLMAVVLGPVYAGIANTPSSVAKAQVPGGATVPGGITAPDGDWYSTIAHIDILTTQPANYDDATYYDIVSQVRLFLDDLLPCWVTFDVVLDGVHGVGFFLDEVKNLDNQRFRV